jgi:hypothetical protein
MSSEKPKDIDEYKRWLKSKHAVEISSREEAYYKAVTERIARDLQVSDFWTQLTKSLPECHDEYLLNTGYPLLLSRESQPLILIKPFDSFLLKTYRKNVLANTNWPQEPQGGWVFPSNWYSKINDTIRTLIGVKYLDGVEFMIERIKSFCGGYNVECKAYLEAREEGYYAAHLYIRQDFEIPKVNWDTERVNVAVEVQITTQLQEVIRRLLHGYYEDRRKAKDNENTKWQWNYKSEEFSAAYLGHILHYVEGMIMEIRERQRQKEKIQ